MLPYGLGSNLKIAANKKGPLWEGAPAKPVGERAYVLAAAKETVSPSVRFADSSLAEGAFFVSTFLFLVVLFQNFLGDLAAGAAGIHGHFFD